MLIELASKHKSLAEELVNPMFRELNFKNSYLQPKFLRDEIT